MVRIRILVGTQVEVDEEPIVGVPVGRGGRLVGHGHDALVVLTRGLGDELLDPNREGLQGWGGEVGDLVTPGQRQLAQRGAQSQRRVLGLRFRPGGVGERRGAIEQGREVHPDERSRHQTKVRQGRIAATNVRLSLENAAKATLVGQTDQRCAGVGDGDEIARRINAQAAEPAPEIAVVRERLEGGPGLARDDEQRGGQINLGSEAANGRGVRTVEDAQGRMAGRIAEGALEDLGRQA